MAQYPILVQTVANLTELGINASSCRFGLLTMESDRFICVKDVAPDGAGQVVVVDMHKNNAVTRKPMKGEASMMNPVDNIIVVNAKTEGQPGHFVQVLNLETKTKIAAYQSNENIMLWKWITPRIIGLVTESTVYHWDIDSKDPPVKAFDRAGPLTNPAVQLVNYTADKEQKWALLTGISTSDQGKTVDGCMQLYCIRQKKQQFFEGHAGCFGELVLEESKGPSEVFAFVERKNNSNQSKLHIIDIYAQRIEGKPAPFKILTDVQYPAENPSDFPISINISKKYGVVYILSKGGVLLLYEANQGNCLFRHRICQDTLFTACDHKTIGGILAVSRKGAVLSCTINENALLPFIQTQLTHLANRQQLSISFAKKYGLPGADDVLFQAFNQAFACGEYKEAARIAAIMKSGGLRTLQVINQFKQVAAQPGKTSPIIEYFSTLLEYGKLNAIESCELVRPIVSQGRKEFITRWLQEDKLECTGELGDIIKPLCTKLAVQIYIRAQSSAKVVQAYVEQGEFDSIVSYCKGASYTPDYTSILRSAAIQSAEASGLLANQLLKNDPPLLDAKIVMEVMGSQGRWKEMTSALLDYLKGNLPEQGPLQTTLLELNLVQAPHVAETIFQSELFSYYDKNTIAVLCEKAGLYQRALEHYQDVNDIKRVMTQIGGQLSTEWMHQFFGKLQPEVCLEMLSDMLRTNRQNLQPVVTSAVKFHENIGAMRLVHMFETFSSYEGIFYFLGAIVNTSTDPDVHFKYIEAASKLQHLAEVERICRESKIYDPQRVKEFLKVAKLSDPRPLIYVCDIHGFVAELAEYLYKNSLMKYIEVYVQKVNPKNTPIIIGTLMDLDCGEEFIKNLLHSVRGLCPGGPLVEEVESRNRLRTLLPWLEARMTEGCTDVEVHDALAKIYVDLGRDPELFLKTNAFYDSRVVGRYCEDRDPHLAFTAYRRAWGTCDRELLDVTNRNGLFRLQARYLVERQNPELWQIVLNESNEFRRSVIDQVVSSAIPECNSSDEVSATVKAFIDSQAPKELIELLDKIVLHNPEFSGNKNLQNLLILTAITTDPERVMDYINRLDKYDAAQIASIATEYRLYEEAFVIYKKFNMNVNAVETLLAAGPENLDRALEYCQRQNEVSAWSKLGLAQMREGNISDAIDSFLKADDPEHYSQVIDAAEAREVYEPLVSFLYMARKHTNIKDQKIDTSLVYALAKADRLPEMEEFVTGTNTANIGSVGDRLFSNECYRPAKLLYQNIPNNAKLAQCLVLLHEFAAAVEAAKKANSPKTWKEVCCACLDNKEYKCAHVAGLNLLIHPDHVDELIHYYERKGAIDELISLLESAVSGERAHVGLYTELGIAYSKYKPDRLMDFCRNHRTRINVPKLTRACENAFLWNEALFLHVYYDETDQAIMTMINHGPSCWKHDQFMQLVQKISNAELLYKCVRFYLEYHPMLVNELLKSMEKSLDMTRLVNQIRKSGHLPVIQKFLLEVQLNNISAVNEAVNELLLESEDFGALKESIGDYDNFDQLDLALKLADHKVSAMRRIAVLLYKKNDRYKQAMDLSRKDKRYKEAMETAKDSGSYELVEDLLRFFVDNKEKECFSAMLYVCYDVLKPDIVMELAWRANLMDYVMPYMIQVMNEYSQKIENLDKKIDKKEAADDKLKSAPNDYNPDMMMLPGVSNLAIMPPPPSHIDPLDQKW